jgi:hypothetical protein
VCVCVCVCVCKTLQNVTCMCLHNECELDMRIYLLGVLLRGEQRV